MQEELKNQKEGSIEPENEEQVYYGVGSFLWEVVKLFVLVAVIMLPIRTFLFQPFRVQGASMQPNFQNNDYLIVNELTYKQTDVKLLGTHLFTVNATKVLKRGEVVVFRYPKNPEQYFIKRVVGLPGEQIKIVDGRVKIFSQGNPEGEILDESAYLPKGLITSGTVELTLSQDQYFVLGDNRANSSDSRVWGPLPKNDVIGKVLIRAWPFSKAEIL